MTEAEREELQGLWVEGNRLLSRYARYPDTTLWAGDVGKVARAVEWTDSLTDDWGEYFERVKARWLEIDSYEAKNRCELSPVPPARVESAWAFFAERLGESFASSYDQQFRELDLFISRLEDYYENRSIVEPLPRNLGGQGPPVGRAEGFKDWAQEELTLAVEKGGTADQMIELVIHRAQMRWPNHSAHQTAVREAQKPKGWPTRGRPKAGV
jgi:hypothetical protein